MHYPVNTKTNLKLSNENNMSVKIFQTTKVQKEKEHTYFMVLINGSELSTKTRNIVSELMQTEIKPFWRKISERLF